MKRNTLTTAVLAGLTGMAGMVSVSNATGVHVNPEGHGQVLIYPFYTARGGNDTLISIVNTKNRGKAVKVRFREALNSREVLDFHLYMSPFDVWVAAVTSNDAGGATLFTGDTSCTVPAIPSTGVDFLTFDFSQAEVKDEFSGTIDGAGTGAERTASGYIEVIEMASMKPAADQSAANDKLPTSLTGWVEYASKHDKGVPRNCQALVNAWTTGLPDTAVRGGAFITDPTSGLDPATGGLFGSASIINGANGTMFSYNAVALENFWAAGDTPGTSKEKTTHSTPGDDAPNLASTGNTKSKVLFGGAMVEQTFGFGIQAVSAALAQSAISNEYVIEAGIGAQTEWVVTFPTKSYHVDPFQKTEERGGVVTTQAAAPFTSVWASGVAANATFKPACEGFEVDFWDREEQTTTEAPAGAIAPVFSPRQFASADVQKPSFELCSEANVISFSDVDADAPEESGILAEPARANGLGLVNIGLEFESGWASIDLVTSVSAGTTNDPALVKGTRKMLVAGASGANNQEAILGLPAVGFAVTTYTNGELESGALANYGGTFNHRGSRSITSS